jgi:hypothetical protein
VQAEVHGGTLAAAGRWVRGQADSYDGDITLRGVDLSQLQYSSARYGPRPLKGRLFAQATVFGAIPEEKPLNGLRASGEFEIIQGQLFGLPVLKDIFQRVPGMREVATVDDAAAVFDIADGQIVLRDAAVNAPVLGLQGGGTMGFDGKVNLDVVAAPLADWKEKLRDTKVPIVSNVAGEVAGAIQKILNSATGTLLYQFRIAGDTKKVEILTVPTPVLTDTAAFVFGKMMAPKKDQRPLDWFRREQSKAAAAQ